MTTSQIKLIGAATISLVAFLLWLWSYFAIAGSGFLRTLLLFAIVYFCARPYRLAFEQVSREHPVSRRIIGGIVAVWLLVMLAALVATLSLGHEIPLHRGPNRALGFLLFIAPVLPLLGLRIVQVYRRLGRVDI